MNSPIVVAYDGSQNADDAVVLGQALAQLTGGELVVAHIYRLAVPQPTSGAATLDGHNAFLRHRGEELLDRAAEIAGSQPRRIVEGATTTATGIRTLAEREHAAVVVFGSATHTEPGHVHPGSASRRLLQGSPAAVAFAPAGYRQSASGVPTRIAVSHDDDSATARASAEALARAVGTATLVEPGEADLLVLGSRPGGEHGRVMISASAEAPLQSAKSPVVVVARGIVLPSAALQAVA